jgi:hypothetical protein
LRHGEDEDQTESPSQARHLTLPQVIDVIDLPRLPDEMQEIRYQTFKAATLRARAAS